MEKIDLISYYFLQQYWWVIISLLAGALVFLMFVQGGQTLLYAIGKTDDERTMLVNVLGRKWELTFTTLVVFGGAFFAAFPLFYATSFGGAYWLWMLILFCFILQAVAYEFRSKPSNLFGSKTYEIFLFINGAAGTFLLGVAVGGLFTGNNFSVNMYNNSRWESVYHGLENILEIKNVLLGLSVLFLVRISGLLYFMNTIDDPELFNRAKKKLIINSIPFLIFFLTFLVILFLSNGYAYDPQSMNIYLQSYKYFTNLIEMPLLLLLFVFGIILVLSGIGFSIFKPEFKKGFWLTGTGTLFTVLVLFLMAGLNHTAYYPSAFNIQNSLTIQNSSSSYYTLKVMALVSLFLPFVIGYIGIAWRNINKEKMNKEEIKENFHVY